MISNTSRKSHEDENSIYGDKGDISHDSRKSAASGGLKVFSDDMEFI
jgi:hypothetical protein